MAIGLAVAFVLRPAPFPHGLKTGIAFAAYLISQAILSDRFTNERRTRGVWIYLLCLAAVTVGAMWLIDR